MTSSLPALPDVPALPERLRIFERAVASARNGVAISDARLPERPLVYVNKAFCSITGYPSAEVIGRASDDFLNNLNPRQPALEVLRQARRSGRDCEVVLQSMRKDGTTFWNQFALSVVRDTAGEITHFIGTMSDITDRRTYEVELAYLATRDPVTGLPLLVAQEDFIAQARAAADRNVQRVAFVVMEIDRFSNVIESMGPATGDIALRTVGERLRAAAGEQARVARLTSDSFLVVLPQVLDEDEAVSRAQQLSAAVEPPVPVQAYSLHLTCTAGVALYPDHAEDTQSLLHCAEMALSRGRRRRNSVVPFMPEFASELRDRFALGARLRDAIAGGELVLHYQPQVRALDGCVLGLEALVRWQTSSHGLLLPGRFLRAAEDLGLTVPLGMWVFRDACRQVRDWMDRGLDEFRLAVNVSAQQLHAPNFVRDVRAYLREFDVPASRLEVELTEDTLIDNVNEVLAVMGQLKDLGLSLALDDFGTGYSSLNYLRRLPIDKLKIDRSFIAEVTTATNDAAIVRAIIAMGHQLRLSVLAEGLETEAQLSFLHRNHCDAFQGYFFSRPVDAQAATGLLRQRHLMSNAFVAARPARRLLLVDDEDNVLRALARLFRRDGYEILLAHTADRAFDLLARQEVQVILSDQRMPGMNGTEFLGRVKDQYPDTVRLMLSGYTDLASVTEAVNRGSIYRFLTKPWDDAELRNCVSEAFRSHEARNTADAA